jgi:hypothetical protein
MAQLDKEAGVDTENVKKFRDSRCLKKMGQSGGGYCNVKINLYNFHSNGIISSSEF